MRSNTEISLLPISTCYQFGYYNNYIITINADDHDNVITIG